MDTTGKALVEHWKWAGQKGKMNRNTASAKGAACNQVLGVLDDWETLDVSALDTEDVLQRFVNLRSKDFTPDSLATYKRRFTSAVREFLAYTKDPAGWKAKGSPDRSAKPTNGKKRVAEAADSTGNGRTSSPHNEPLPARTGLVEYPFPLREGRFAYLRLPADLKLADVKRLTGFLNTLADDSDTIN
jgi:hypothetical protein